MLNKKRLPLIITVAVITPLFLVLAVTQKYVFFINDDKNNMDILTGKYINGPTNLLIQMSQIICGPLYLMYQIFPMIPFYGLLLLITMWGSCVIIGACMIQTDSKIRFWRSLVIYLSLVLILMFFHIVNTQYTIVAIFPMLAVIALFNRYPQGAGYKVKVGYYVAIGALCVLSCGIRANVFLLSLPFVGLVLLYLAVKDRRRWLSLVLVLGLFFAALGLNRGVDAIVYQNAGADWKNYVEFHNVRTDLCDFYGFPDYHAARELYDSLGMSQTSVEMIKGDEYCFDLEEASVTNLQAILAYQKAHTNWRERFKNSFDRVSEIYRCESNFRQLAFYTHAVLFEMLLLILFFIYSFFICQNKHRWEYLFLAFLGVGMWAFSVLIAFLMKFECRVATVINLLGFISLFVFVNQNQQIEFNREDLSRPMILICGLLVLMSVMIKTTSIFNHGVQAINQEKYALESRLAADSDYLYFLDNGTLISPQTENPLGATKRIHNVFYCSWNSHSPYVKQAFQNAGYENFNDLLARADNLRIVIKDRPQACLSYQNYLQEKYGRACVLTDENFGMDGIYVYQVI